MMQRHLYLLQRITAAIMVPLVIGHLAVMIYAVQGGLSAAEILGRTQGSVIWAMFYGTFAIAVAIHAAIGVSNIAEDWLRLRGWSVAAIGLLVCIGLLGLGLHAVFAVTAGP
ncbi:MAG: succinate dehydrogenase [Pseudomonadota bacterium]